MTQIVHIQNRNGSISSDSSLTDSSIGFGDFENDVIRDELERMDEMRVNQMTRATEETRIDRVELQNSSGIVIGNQTFIEGTVIFDRRVPNEVDSDLKKEENLKETEKETPKKPFRRWKNIVKIVTITIVVLLLAVCAVLLIFYFINNQPESITEPPVSSTTTPSTTISTTPESSTEVPTTPIPLTYTLVSRSEWGASRPLYIPESIAHPVKSIVITETGTNPCSTNDTCIKIVREEQQKYIRLTWADIGHSFLAADFNAVYEGSGWNKSGQHTKPLGSNCYVIAFIGTFAFKKPTDEQINAYLALIEEGVREKYIDENYEMVAHCQLSTANRPGTALREMLKNWPHWKSTDKKC